jgi:amidophosphoribosyltransferase
MGCFDCEQLWGIHEECGVFGIYNPAGDCARDTYYGLYALQHRGQESCGIAANNDRDITCYKDMGMVGEVFSEEKLDELNGTMAIGHVRYSTAGGSKRENAQPLTLSYIKNNLALVHNGNLVNAQELKHQFELTGSIFQTTADTEVIAYAIARQRLQCGSIEQAVIGTMKKLVGAYSLVVMSSRKLIAARDPWGFRPLCIGKRGDAWLFASESCALDGVGAEFVRDVEPGEVVLIEDGQLKSFRDNCSGQSHICIFEYIYFARPDSVIGGQGVHEARLEAGRLLARQNPVDADVVIGVPDSGLDAALGYAQESGIPVAEGFLKNRYIGRTFIKPSQASRETAVKLKLSPMRSQLEGKRVIMIDDSIVRGTTSNLITNLLREAGAKEVHVKISSPPFISPCYFGTDVPDKQHLIACSMDLEAIRKHIGADTLDYLNVESLRQLVPHIQGDFCQGCFTGEYPVAVPENA